MRILLLHPDDSPLTGPWVGQVWDLVFDLGRGGAPACERWGRVLGCPVKAVDDIREGQAEIREVRELLKVGLGSLIDREGLDWWELTAILFHFPMEMLVVLRKWASGLPRQAEVWITRPSLEADALRLLLGGRLHVVSARTPRSRKGVRHYFERLRQLPASQVLQILGDKYDAGYRWRRHLHARLAPSPQSVVLAPSSYINMSLTVAAYARHVPDQKFLLVSTRSSGWLKEVPDNVSQRWLAAYAGESIGNELQEILQRWRRLRKELESFPELAAMGQLGLMDDFPRRFADGLAIRDAWLGVLNHEPVQAVLCCDDSNPATQIPMLLGRKRGAPAISCHHGAFDGRYLIKRCHSDIVLAKGKMELDYLVNTCRVDPAVVEIGAPVSPARSEREPTSEGDWIVFFSEPYEAMVERTEEIYRDLIPALADLARRMGKKLVVKVHPSENLKDRKALVAKVFTRDQSAAIEWIAGRMAPDLLRRTWFGVTVQSSVAVECAVYGVPCFICDWLDLWPYGYIGQYRRFGIAMGLHAPSDIEKIPERLAGYRPDQKIAASCWETIAPQRLKEILTGRRAAALDPVGMQRAK